MQLSFTPIKGTSRKYKVLVAVLAVLALAGIVAYMVSCLEGMRAEGGAEGCLPEGGRGALQEAPGPD